MNSSMENSFSRHRIASRGVLSQPNPQTASMYTPKVIDYRHTVRIITPFQCSHQNIIQNLKKENQLKSKQIDDLKKIIQIKSQEIQEKKKEIESMREMREKESKFQRQRKCDILLVNPCEKQITHEPIQFMESNITLLKETFWDQDERESQNFKKIKMEIQSTQDVLNDLSRVLEKPKKKYTFYHKHLNPPNTQMTPLDFNKKLDLTNCGQSGSRIFSSSGVIQTSRSVQCGSIIHSSIKNISNNLANTSLDLTQADQSKDTTYFLEEAIKEHRFLQKSLMQLQNKTKNEIEQLKQSYEEKIRTYIDLFERQKEKNERMTIQCSHYNTFSLLDQQQLQNLQSIGYQQQQENRSFFDELVSDNILIDQL